MSEMAEIRDQMREVLNGVTDVRVKVEGLTERVAAQQASDKRLEAEVAELRKGVEEGRSALRALKVLVPLLGSGSAAAVAQALGWIGGG